MKGPGSMLASSSTVEYSVVRRRQTRKSTKQQQISIIRKAAANSGHIHAITPTFFAGAARGVNDSELVSNTVSMNLIVTTSCEWCKLADCTSTSDCFDSFTTFESLWCREKSVRSERG
jgi:hypothetical protein